MNITDSNFQIDMPLPLPHNQVQLWRVDLEAIRSAESRWREVLSSDELQRASRFHFEGDRQRYVAARSLLRRILAAYLSLTPQELRFVYSDKEKPSLALAHAGSGIKFNLSHSGGVALYAFARDHDLGVDVERIRHDFEVEPLARRFFSPHEQNQLAGPSAAEKVEAFFRCWTRKEAYIKATGDGLSLPLTQFDVSLESGSSDALAATRPDGSEARQWLLTEVSAGAGYAAALCVRGRDWKLKSWSDTTPWNERGTA
jgi:4'-phosphopantetheinyl transferase